MANWIHLLEANYGLLDRDLLDWIETRASDLLGQIERYTTEEINYLPVDSGKRVVVEVLLQDTLASLRGLEGDNLPTLKWVRQRLKNFKKIQPKRVNLEQEILSWIEKLIGRNLKIEAEVVGTKHPGDEWMINTQALKRILDELRVHSGSISKLIVNHLGSKFNLMSRWSVHDRNRPDDGLYCWKAKGLVPSELPFSAQDAIANEALV